MAYISAEDTKKIRTKLKEEFPKCKFSVKNQHHLEVSVVLLSSDMDFSDILDRDSSCRVNQYHLEHYGKHEKFFKKVDKIIRTAGVRYYDNSDAQIDYFDTAFYYDISVGDYDRPYVQK